MGRKTYGPVGGSGHHLEAISQLEGVNGPQNLAVRLQDRQLRLTIVVARKRYLLNVATSGHGVEHGEAHLMVRTDDEQGADGLAHLGILLLLLVEHAQADGQVASRVGDDRVGEVPGNVQAIALDVVHPVHVRVQCVNGMRQALGVPLGKLRLVHRNPAQLSGADGSEVGGVREEHHPAGDPKENW